MIQTEPAELVCHKLISHSQTTIISRVLGRKCTKTHQSALPRIQMKCSTIPRRVYSLPIFWLTFLMHLQGPSKQPWIALLSNLLLI